MACRGAAERREKDELLPRTRGTTSKGNAPQPKHTNDMPPPSRPSGVLVEPSMHESARDGDALNPKPKPSTLDHNIPTGWLIHGKKPHGWLMVDGKKPNGCRLGEPWPLAQSYLIIQITCGPPVFCTFVFTVTYDFPLLIL